MLTGKATACASANLALIKCWGDRTEAYRLRATRQYEESLNLY